MLVEVGTSRAASCRARQTHDFRVASSTRARPSPRPRRRTSTSSAGRRSATRRSAGRALGPVCALARPARGWLAARCAARASRTLERRSRLDRELTQHVRLAQRARPFDRRRRTISPLRKVGRAVAAAVSARSSLAAPRGAGEYDAVCVRRSARRCASSAARTSRIAVAAHQRAIELEPDYADAHFNLARALVARARHARAALPRRRAHLAPRRGRPRARRRARCDRTGRGRRGDRRGASRSSGARTVVRAAACAGAWALSAASAALTRNGGRDGGTARHRRLQLASAPRVEAQVVRVACLERHGGSASARELAGESRPPRGAAGGRVSRGGAAAAAERRLLGHAPAAAAAKERGQARVVELLGHEDKAHALEARDRARAM